MLKTTINFIFTILFTSLLVSVVSTQIVLTEIQGYGLTVPFMLRVSVTFNDMLGLVPGLFLLLTVCFLIAFSIARYVCKLLNGSRWFWFTLAGLCAFPVTLLLIRYVVGVTLLTSARTLTGMLLIASCCAAGGWLYSFLTITIKDN